jgi:hypothetical protein
MSSNHSFTLLRNPDSMIRGVELLLGGVEPTIARIMQRRWAIMAPWVSRSPWTPSELFPICRNDASTKRRGVRLLVL